MGRIRDEREERLEREELERRLQGLTLREAFYKGLDEFRGHGWNEKPTLRDKFAMSLCRSEVIKDYVTPTRSDTNTFDETARICYKFADSFLRERNRLKGE